MNVINNQKGNRFSAALSDRVNAPHSGDDLAVYHRIYGILSLLKEREILRSSIDHDALFTPSHAASEMAAELLEEALQALEKESCWKEN